MTAVDATQAVGKPMDLNAVMDGSPVKAARPGVSPKAENSAFSFGDFIDVINPLQHIPGIAELYRSVTNDEISDNARKAGNALYGFALGGPVGLGAMLAYNEVGDRLNSSQENVTAQPVEVAEVAPAGEPAPTSDVPVPVRKPGVEPTATEADKAAGTAVLGETVASAGRKGAPPTALVDLINSTGAAPGPVGETMTSPDKSSSGNASSVSYLDMQDSATPSGPVMPDQQGLDRLASHKSNHLPLDVLKALQERHAERSVSERT
ncbi:hypothetical protein HEP89_21365 [Labrenzia sp. 5N]|uniref:hypothetical protein n=1 Tax=Labrenzia sp. 5N TaxID=2723402 RepID=UPI0014477134|nr:hypothetical protein [Labrenzia sp. 5N]NKX66678.1 hypothetical protein [Labrenzia sp. 5N]